MIERLKPETDGLLGRADDVYEALLNAHRGLDEAASAALNARLILLLAHLAGDPEAVLAAIAAAQPARLSATASAALMPSTPAERMPPA